MFFTKTLITSSILFVLCSALFEGDDCIVSETNEEGQCIKVLECEYAKNLLKSKKFPQTCGFIFLTPLVCCPQPKEAEFSSFGYKSSEACEKYYNASLEFIGVSQVTPPKKISHLAAVGFGEEEIHWLCSGSLISEKFILTAAHCTVFKDFGVVRWIRLGDSDLKNLTKDTSNQNIAVVRFILHPEYKPPLRYHDIALLQLQSNTYFNIYNQPACLHLEKELPLGALQAVGWSPAGDDLNSHPTQVDLMVIGHEKCTNNYFNASLQTLTNGTLDDYQICVENTSESLGDLGVTLHFYQDSTDDDCSDLLGHYIIVGIRSFDGIFTRVSAYIEWIESVAWPQEQELYLPAKR